MDINNNPTTSNEIAGLTFRRNHDKLKYLHNGLSLIFIGLSSEISQLNLLVQ